LRAIFAAFHQFMLFALTLALSAVAGATLLTYLYDRDANLWMRLCTGVCTGFAALGLIGFALSSLSGMTTLVLATAGACTAAPLLLLRDRNLRERISVDLCEAFELVQKIASARLPRSMWGVVTFYLLASAILWYVCDRVMYENVAGIFTGLDTNIGDLPFHLAVITGFAHGENFPPQHPELAGVAMTYPFVTDFVTAMFVRAGASISDAMFWQNYTLMLALTGLLHRWALVLTRDRVAAILTPVLVFFSGGFGWLKFLEEAAKGPGIFAALRNLTHDYTIMAGGYRWGNIITALFVPQRGILLGAALAIVVWTLWAKSAETKASERETANESQSIRAALSDFCASPFARSTMIAAGVVAGLLPLVHAHSFVVTIAMGGCLAVLQASLAYTRMPRGEGKAIALLRPVCQPWIAFFAVAFVVAAPQMLWATRGSAVQAGSFFAFEPGWDHGEENIAWFWLKNTAFFIPLLVTALVWRGNGRVVTSRLLYFYLPFTLCFILPNLFRLSPWIWDNVKFLVYWWIASAPLVALLLARLWHGRSSMRALAVALLIAQTMAGALDIWRVASGSVERQTIDRAGIAFARMIRRDTPPQSLILHAPTYNDPVYLTGRRSFLGYPGHLWSHGLAFSDRENHLQQIYTGWAEATELLRKNGIEYVVVGPLEEAALNERRLKVNRAFFESFPKVGEEGEYRLYKTAQQ
jgi:hypothetical protein